MNGAGRDDHSIDRHGAAGDVRADVFDGMPGGDQVFEIGGCFSYFEIGSAFSGAAQDEMRLDAFFGAEFFQESPAVNGAAGSGDSDDNSQISFLHLPLFGNQNKISPYPLAAINDRSI